MIPKTAVNYSDTFDPECCQKWICFMIPQTANT